MLAADLVGLVLAIGCVFVLAVDLTVIAEAAVVMNTIKCSSHYTHT